MTSAETMTAEGRRQMLDLLSDMVRGPPRKRARAASRANDLAERLGGWEVLITQPPDTDIELVEIAHRLRSYLSPWQRRLVRGLRPLIHGSIGISERQRECLERAVAMARVRVPTL